MKLNPKDIRYSQDSIKSTFNNGKSIYDLLEDLRSGKVTVDQVADIRVCRCKKNEKGEWVPCDQPDSLWFTLDNRRLWVFKEYGCSSIPVKQVYKIPPGRMTTKNDGTSVRIRGQRPRLRGGASHQGICGGCVAEAAYFDDSGDDSDFDW